MRNFLVRFKIPTLLGLAIILFGIAFGVFLTLQNQIFISKASPDVTPQNIMVSNISDDSVAISWQTSSASTAFISYGVQNTTETALDDRDTKSPQPHLMHHVTIKNLLPKTEYQYKIISGKTSEAGKFTTATPLLNPTGYKPIVGSVLNGEKPLQEGIAYLSISGAVTQTTLIKSSGNFLIPMSQIRTTDLSEVFSQTEETTATLTILSPDGEATTLFKLKKGQENLPIIKLGDNLDLTLQTPAPQLFSAYDFNEDGKVNANDNSILLQNFGKNPTNKKADLNGDGTVDKKDLDLLSKQINQ